MQSTLCYQRIKTEMEDHETESTFNMDNYHLTSPSDVVDFFTYDLSLEQEEFNVQTSCELKEEKQMDIEHDETEAELRFMTLFDSIEDDLDLNFEDLSVPASSKSCKQEQESDETEDDEHLQSLFMSILDTYKQSLVCNVPEEQPSRPTDLQAPSPPSVSQSETEKEYVKKPPNAFMVFVKEQRENVMTETKLLNNATVLQVLGVKWRNMTMEEKDKYYDKAKELKRVHSQLYPNWSFKDNYGTNKLKKTHISEEEIKSEESEKEPIMEPPQSAVFSVLTLDRAPPEELQWMLEDGWAAAVDLTETIEDLLRPIMENTPSAYSLFCNMSKSVALTQYPKHYTDQAFIWADIFRKKWKNLPNYEKDHYYKMAHKVALYTMQRQSDTEVKRLHNMDKSFTHIKGQAAPQGFKRKQEECSMFDLMEERDMHSPTVNSAPSAFTLFSMKKRPAILAMFTKDITNVSIKLEENLKQQWKDLPRKEKGSFYTLAHEMKTSSVQQQSDTSVKRLKNSDESFTDIKSQTAPQGFKGKQEDCSMEKRDVDSKPSAFTLFSMKKRPAVLAMFPQCITNNSNKLEEILKQEWKDLPSKEKGRFYTLAHEMKTSSNVHGTCFSQSIFDAATSTPGTDFENKVF